MEWSNGTPVSFETVTLQNGFWAEKQRMLRDVTAHAVYDRFSQTGRFAALKADWKEGDPNKPHIFWESDIAKWIEGAAYLLQKQRDTHLEALIDEAVSLMQAYQQEDGYLNVYFTVVEPDARFTRCTDHELYCAGHLIEAAVAYDRATGKKELLDMVRKYVDLIDRVFRVEHSASFDTPGHEEIELALYRLYRHTGEEKYLTLMQYFINTRGTSERDKTYGFAGPAYMQAHLPVREQTTAEGHSVRALYLYIAMADLALETHDAGLRVACETLFDNITTKRMYITGGVGSTYHGEAFTYDYHLPEYTAYCETCASIALALFARRMWLMQPHRKYADTAELAIYNTVLAGISLSGDRFFYENPLAADAVHYAFEQSKTPQVRERLPLMERPPVFDCSCCPPNLLRFIASIGDFMYSTTGDTVYAHCFMAGTASLALERGTLVIDQQTGYPSPGEITLRILEGSCPDLAIRIPGWSKTYTLAVNGKQVAGTDKDGYLHIGSVHAGDVVSLQLDFSVLLVRANPKVRDACGRWAVTRGPLVYCAEGHDNPYALRDIRLAADTRWEARSLAIGDLPVPALKGTASVTMDEDALYSVGSPTLREVPVLLIPYYAWANRGPADMTVWMLQGAS